VILIFLLPVMTAPSRTRLRSYPHPANIRLDKKRILSSRLTFHGHNLTILNEASLRLPEHPVVVIL
jgi:hypothetical protein